MIGILKKIALFIAALLAATFILAGYVWFEVNVPKVSAISIASGKIDHAIRVVQISDVHGKRIASHRGIMKAVSDFHPSAVLLTGDLTDRSTEDFSGIYEDVKELKNIAPVIFVTGNHELANPKGEAFINGLRDAGVTVLRNSSIAFEEGETSSFNILGIEDIHFGGDSLQKTLKGVDGEKYNILLSHTPEVASEIQENSIIDLVLSGHTHGGQVRLPFFGAIFLPDSSLDPRLVKGIATLGNGVVVYTDSGFGTSAIPIRFMDRSQISFITVSGE